MDSRDAVGTKSRSTVTHGRPRSLNAARRPDGTADVDGDAFDLEDCLARVRNGDPAAARELVRHTHGPIARWVRAHRPRGIAGDDLVQEVYVKVFTHLDSYQPRAGVPFEHWLARVTIRTCVDALRREQRAPRIEALDVQAPAAADGADADEAAEESGRRVQAWLARLEPLDRAILTWIDIEEVRVVQVAAWLGWSATRVKVRAFRARRKLRALYDSGARP